MSGFGQHYKGDVSEVTMGHETGLFIQGLQPATFVAAASTGASGTHDYTQITFDSSSTTDGGLFYNDILKVPLGMLIGQKLTFHNTNNGSTESAGLFAAFQYNSTNARVYSIVDHTLVSSATVIKIVPALTNAGAITSNVYDAIQIHSLGMPTVHSVNANFAMHADANASKEVSSIDQFIGLASFMTLPDTTVDLHRYHVVGLGRQTAVQQAGKVHHMGGSIELPLHDPKWLYYSLGKETVSKDYCGGTLVDSSPVPTIYQGVSPGATYLDVASSQAASVRFGSGSIDAGIGDYLLINDTTRAPTVTYRAPLLGITGNTDVYFWPNEASGSSLESDDENFDWTETSECRRIVAIEDLDVDLGAGVAPSRYPFRIHLDGPLNFTHTTADTLALKRYTGTNASGSPHVHTTNEVRNFVHRLIFSGETNPSFSIEHSVRNRDVGSANASGETPTNTVGSATDSQQLTRIFRGCKVVEWELSSTVDAELKYRCVFDALSCYTDTGRLEANNKGDRYTAHRMFQNTATGATADLQNQSRKASGIAAGTDKPFMFYNGEIQAFGTSMGLVSGFELRGKTGVELFHTIQGNPIAEDTNAAGLSQKQVPYGGTRNASIIREGREEFEMEIDLALTDATLYHQLRSHVHTNAVIGDATGYIKLKFTKPVTGTTGTLAQGYAPPTLTVILDDYYITECPVPVPDDKGLLHTKIKLKPQNIKVMSYDALYHC